jgi:transposase
MAGNGNGRNLHDYLYGILADCRWPLHTGLLKGINNQIKAIKRMAYGLVTLTYTFNTNPEPLSLLLCGLGLL